MGSEGKLLEDTGGGQVMNEEAVDGLVHMLVHGSSKEVHC